MSNVPVLQASVDPTLLADRMREAKSDQATGLPQTEKVSETKPNVPDGLDLNKPMSVVLREGTIAIHDEINGSPAAQLLTSGELAKSEYIRFLFMLWHIYEYVAIISVLSSPLCRDPF